MHGILPSVKNDHLATVAKSRQRLDSGPHVCTKEDGMTILPRISRDRLAIAGLLALAVVLAVSTPAVAQSYTQHNLVSDLPGVAPTTDPNLVNPWGIVFPPTGPFWISDNNAGVSTLYDGNGNPFPVGSPL